MSLISPESVVALFASYGPIVVAVVVGLESMGMPLPGETVLLLAAGYAAGHPDLALWPIIVAAATGAILGDNVGYWLGRSYGLPILARHGRHIGLGPERLQLGQMLFRRHGIAIVFFGRFVAILRILAAWLAGISHMHWRQFLAANAAGAVLWASAFGLAGFYFGKLIASLPVTFEIALVAAGIAILVALHIISRRAEGWLLRRQSEAETQRTDQIDRG